MSSLISKLSKSHKDSTDDRRGSDFTADKYRLLVTAGPSYNTKEHKIVHVNTDVPTAIENEFLRAKIKVRIRGYRGLPSHSPDSSPYFDDPRHDKDQYSVAFSFVPKRDLPCLDTVWGNDFDHPVRDRLPPGFNTAFKIVKDYIDPGLECDAYADEPWLYGPSLSCWFAFRIGDKIGDDDIPEAEEGQDVLEEGADGSGSEVRQQYDLPQNNEKRRKHFLSAAHREPFTFEAGRLYRGDFYNPYLDFGNFALKLPGFSIKVIKYIDDKSHCLRYVFKNRATGDVYFCVNLNLLQGEQIERATQDEHKEMQAYAGAEANALEHEKDEEQELEVDIPNHERHEEQDLDGDKFYDTNETPIQIEKQETAAGAEANEVPATQQPPPGLSDKPAYLIEQIKGMKMDDMLNDTATEKKVGVKTNVLSLS